MKMYVQNMYFYMYMHVCSITICLQYCMSTVYVCSLGVRSRLQACPIDSIQSDHTLSNSAVFGKESFRLFSSAVGRLGRLLLPSGVHCFIIFSSNTAYLASFCARVGSLAPFKLGYLAIVSLMSSRDSCMAPDGSAFSLTLTFFSCEVLGGRSAPC